jgi:hypothetical protein
MQPPQYPPQQPPPYPTYPSHRPYGPPTPAPKMSHLPAWLRSTLLGLMIGLAIMIPLACIASFVAVRSGAVTLPSSISVPFLQSAPDGYLYQDSSDVDFITFDQAPQDGPLSGTLFATTKDSTSGKISQNQARWTGSQGNGRVTMTFTGFLGLGTATVVGTWHGNSLIITGQDPTSGGFSSVTCVGASFADYNRAVQALQNASQ